MAKSKPGVNQSVYLSEGWGRMGHLPGLRTSLRIGWSMVSTSCRLKTRGIMGAPSARLDALFAVLNTAPPGRFLSDAEAQLKAGVGDGDVCCNRDDTSFPALIGGDGDRTSFPLLLRYSGTLVGTGSPRPRLPRAVLGIMLYSSAVQSPASLCRAEVHFLLLAPPQKK